MNISYYFLVSAAGLVGIGGLGLLAKKLIPAGVFQFVCGVGVIGLIAGGICYLAENEEASRDEYNYVSGWCDKYESLRPLAKELFADDKLTRGEFQRFANLVSTEETAALKKWINRNK